MKIDLPENIRALRKERRLTQEQLADALGVTTGAVHKWEAGLSVPERYMRIRMAGLFDTSVDALLGYHIKDDSRKAIIERISTGCRIMDPKTLAEAELALTKYPNSFEIVHTCAFAYLVFGMSSHDKAQIRRGRDLLEKALLLLPQNKDPEISEHTLYANISAASFVLGEPDKCLELLKEHNVGGLFNSDIASVLLYSKKPEEAAPYLSKSLYSGYFELLYAASGFAMVFLGRRDYVSAVRILEWGLDTLEGLKTGEGTGYIDKVHAQHLVLLACARLKTGEKEKALETLRTAAELAARFDAASDYGFSSLKYLDSFEYGSAHDALGATAAEGIENMLKQLEDPEITSLWKSVTENK